MNKNNKIKVIKCPHCGYEYLAAEIFLPFEILGNPKNIIRGLDGKIEFVEGDNSSMEETFCCDNCDNDFNVTMNYSFNVRKAEEDIFDKDDYESTLYKNRIQLEEVDLFGDDVEYLEKI